MDSHDTNNCCVVGCRNKQNDSKLCFFTFPKEVESQALWLRAIGRAELIDKTDLRDSEYKVCSKHFTRADKSEVIIRRLRPEAVPTKYLPTSPKLGLLHYERDEGISDVATQTDITYGFDYIAEKDVYVEVDGKKVLIKKEKDPEIPKLNTFLLEKPIKREPIEIEIEIEQSTSKKTKN